MGWSLNLLVATTSKIHVILKLGSKLMITQVVQYRSFSCKDLWSFTTINIRNLIRFSLMNFSITFLKTIQIQSLGCSTPFILSWLIVRGYLNSIFGQISPLISFYFVRLLYGFDLKRSTPLMDLEKFHQPTRAITTHLQLWRGE